MSYKDKSKTVYYANPNADVCNWLLNCQFTSSVCFCCEKHARSGRCVLKLAFRVIEFSVKRTRREYSSWLSRDISFVVSDLKQAHSHCSFNGVIRPLRHTIYSDRYREGNIKYVLLFSLHIDFQNTVYLSKQEAAFIKTFFDHFSARQDCLQ